MRVNTLRKALVVAPFLLSQCYNFIPIALRSRCVVAPFLLSQCYNCNLIFRRLYIVVAPFLLSQCYNTSTGNPYFIRVSRFICYEKMGLK